MTRYRIAPGTNHAIQFFGGLLGKLDGWFEGYIVTAIRNIDFAFSAALMLMVVAVLFLAPVDVQTLTYVFCFQFLTQLAGCRPVQCCRNRFTASTNVTH